MSDITNALGGNSVVLAQGALDLMKETQRMLALAGVAADLTVPPQGCGSS